MECSHCFLEKHSAEYEDYLDTVCECIAIPISICEYCKGFVCPCCLYYYDQDEDVDAYDRAMKGI